MVSKAAMALPDSDEEYLDDPIQLIDFEQKRITAAVKNYNSVNAEPAFEVIDSDGDLYIEKNNNVSKKSLPRLKKVAITLPVTFFEIPRNVDQLNKCKPLSIKVVNCMEHPWYYKKYSNSIDISADIEVEFHSKSRNQPKLDNEDVMIGEGSKIKIRPVTSPYQNLKGDSSKNAICEPRESKLPESASKEKLIHSWNQEKDSQVDFKRNQGLIGMKITQTQETPQTAKKKTKSKLEKTKGKTTKVKTSKDKTTSVKCKSENNTSTDLIATKVKDSKENVVKCTEDAKQDKTVSATKIQDINSTKILNTLKIDSSKVCGDRVISHKTDFESKIQPDQKVNNEVVQNNSKPIVNDNKCDSLNKESVRLEDNVKIMSNCDANSKANIQSTFFTENHDVQKPKLTKVKSKQKLNKPNSIDFTGCKIKRKEHSAPKISNDDGENNKSNTILKDPLHVLCNKTITNFKEKIDKVKDTSKKIASNYVDMAGNESLNSVPMSTTTNGNSVLNIKLVKPGKKVTKKGDSSKTVQSQNQKTNIAKASLIKEQKHNINVKHTLSKNLHTKYRENKSATSAKSSKLLKDLVKTPVLVKNDNIMDTTVQKTNSVNHNISMNLNEAQKETTIIKNNTKLLDESVKTPVLVKNYSKMENSFQNKNVANCQNTTSEMQNTGKQSINNQNTNEYKNIKESNKNHTSAFYIEKYANIMKPSSQQNLSDVTIQIQTSLKKERCNNNIAPKKNTLTNNANEHKQKPVNQPTSNTAVSNQASNNNNNQIQDKTNNSRKIDTVDLTNNINQAKQKKSTNINSNTELVCLSAPNATPINKSSVTTSQSGASTEPRVTTYCRASRDIQSVRNQPQDVSWNNFVPQPCTLQIPLNIPPESKRCPRVIKILKKNPDTTESVLNNINSFDNTSSHLQLAQNSLNKIQFSQPFKNSSTAAPQLYDQNQGLPYLPNFENVPQQKPPTTQQNQQATNLNKISFVQSLKSSSTAEPQLHNQNQGQPYLPNFENIPQQKLPAVQQNQQATNLQMLAHYHAAAQQFVRPPVNQSFMINQNNMQSNAGDISRILPTLQQNIPQMATTKTPGQEANHLLTGQSYNTAPDMLPPTCDIAVIQTLPHHNLNAKTREFQPRQSPKIIRPRILLRKAITKQQLIHRLNNNSAPLRHEVPQNVYPQNFGYGAQPNMQPYGQGFQQQCPISPQNYIHCAPIYEGLPSNMNSVNPVPYDSYWNNYYPTMLPPPPPPPPYRPPIQPHQQQLKPSTSQTCASFNQTNSITTTPESFTGTTVIGCNYAGPVRKINLLPELTEASSMNLNNIQPQIIEPLKFVKNNNETVKCANNYSKQTQLSEKINNNGIKSDSSAGGQDVKQIQDTLQDHIVNSKREMLEELSKITTIESSRFSPVDDIKTPHPSHKTKEVEEYLVKRPLPETNVTKEIANKLNKSLPECDNMLGKDNLIKRPLPQPKVKQQETISEFDEKQDHLIKTPVPKPDANHEESPSLKRPLPTNNEDILIKRSKPGPLSKKLILNATTSPKRTLNSVAHKGYSPPILPIPTYQKSLEILARSNIADSNIPLPNNYERIPELANTTTRYSCEQKQDKLAKKISLDEYKKRCQGDVKVGELHVDKIKIEIKSENSEQDLGYDSDCTPKI